MQSAISDLYKQISHLVVAQADSGAQQGGNAYVLSSFSKSIAISNFFKKYVQSYKDGPF